MDILCKKCGEPWDSYGITIDKGEGDMTLEEVDRFRRGQGCPACGFGTKCPLCDKGKTYFHETCGRCKGTGNLTLISEDEQLRALASLLEASDEEPIGLIDGFTS